MKRFRRFADCQRLLIALRDGTIESVASGRKLVPSYLALGVDLDSITASLRDFETYANDAGQWGEDWADLNEMGAAVLDPLNEATFQQVFAFLDSFDALVRDEFDLTSRVAEAKAGFDAINQVNLLAPVMEARAASRADFIAATNVKEFANAGGFSGAYISLQGADSPFGTVAGPGGEFVHYIFTQLSVEGADPNKIAVLAARDYTATATAGDGIFSGAITGNSGRHEFPFTSFSTVDFDVMIELPDIILETTIQDTAGQAPLVEITRPAENLIVPAGFPLRVQTMSSDDVGVLAVEVYVGGESEIGLFGGLAQGIVQIGETLGPLEIRATAVDAGGLLGSDTVMVQVVDSTDSFFITPDSIRLAQGEAQQFSPTFLGQTITGVTWKVNGFPGGQPLVTGSIDATGFYDTTPADTGGVAGLVVTVSAELEDFPGMEALARVLIMDSRDVIAAPVAFSFPAPGAPGGLLVTRPLAFSFPSPGAPSGLLVSRPLAFSFPAPTAPGGLLVSRPIAFSFPSPAAPGGVLPSRPIVIMRE